MAGNRYGKYSKNEDKFKLGTPFNNTFEEIANMLDLLLSCDKSGTLAPTNSHLNGFRTNCHSKAGDARFT